ncbi:MAG: ATP-binding protein [Bacteroidota bacterium]
MPLHPILAEKLNESLATGPIQPFTRRDSRLPSIPGKTHAVIGMRRTGKTTFLRQLQADRRAVLPAERAIYISFDDDRLVYLNQGQLGQLLEEYYRRFPDLRGKETVSWFLDEVQLVAGWERFVRRVMDSERVEVVVSGSSARMLSREIHTSMRGRSVETIIRPFSFREFLRHRGEEPQKPGEEFSAGERSLIEKRFREYLQEGGFPEAQGLSAPLRVELLQGYVNAVLFRDILERYGITQVAALRWFVRQCLRNSAAALSVHRMHQDLKTQGLGVGKDSLHEMLGYLVDAFLISAIPISTDSERKRNSNPRKIYPVDPGLIRAFDPSGRPQEGRALETVVLNELERRKGDVRYVKTPSGYEVDFHARFPDGTEELIQVCSDISSVGTMEREVRALREASEAYPRAVKRLLLLVREQAMPIQEAGMSVATVYDWLLHGTSA